MVICYNNSVIYQVKFMPKKIKNTKEPSEIAKVHVLNNQISKNVEYIGYADVRAQGIIMISAILVPIVLSGLDKPEFRAAIFIVALTAVLSVFAAIMALVPRRYNHDDDSAHPDIFHFRQSSQLSEKEYFSILSKTLKDQESFFYNLSRDLYHISKLIVAPKFRWLNRSYFIFAFGNLLALILVFFSLSF